MSLPGVYIEILNGALGSVPGTDDGVAGLILSGVAVTGKIALNEPKQIFSLAEAEALGLDEAYDTTNTTDVWEQIVNFYDRAGKGSQLWIMLVAKTVKMGDALDKTIATNAVKLLNTANGAIRILGIGRVPDTGYTPVITTGLDADVWDAVTKGQALAEEFAAKIQPVRIVISGRAWTGVAGDLLNLKTREDNRVGVSLAGMGEGNKNANIGLLLGRLASIPVQRNIGRVKGDGNLDLSAAYLTDGATLESHTDALESIHNKGYIIYRRFTGKAGYYFNDDPTATADTDDYVSIARGRVIDKALVLTYTTYVEEVNDEVAINSDGTLSAAYVKSLQGKVENVINQAMTANGEISSVQCVIDPKQNILSTNKLLIDLRIVPVGYAKEIRVTLGFRNPALNG
jgi:hypothetical protein